MPILKVIEILANSKDGWEDATRVAVKEASKTVKNIRSVYVKDHSCVIDGDSITHFRVTVKVTFEVK